MLSKGRIAQLARASALQAEGHPFKSGFAHVSDATGMGVGCGTVGILGLLMY